MLTYADVCIPATGAMACASHPDALLLRLSTPCSRLWYAAAHTRAHSAPPSSPAAYVSIRHGCSIRQYSAPPSSPAAYVSIRHGCSIRQHTSYIHFIFHINISMYIDMCTDQQLPGSGGLELECLLLSVSLLCLLLSVSLRRHLLPPPATGSRWRG
jgi:hypothetical protein